MASAKAKGFIKGALLVPAMGLVAHGVMGVVSSNYDWNAFGGGHWPTDEEYSLKHRFETACSFNTPEEHKTYVVYEPIFRDGSWEHGQGEKVPYWPASPYMTYGAMLAAGLIGARRQRD